MRMYNTALTTDHKHNLEPTLFTSSLTRFGAKILSQSTSVWKIKWKLHPYMYDCMLYFFGSTTSSLFIEGNFSMRNWLARLRSQEKDITVYNTDILAKVRIHNMHATCHAPPPLFDPPATPTNTISPAAPCSSRAVLATTTQAHEPQLQRRTTRSNSQAQTESRMSLFPPPFPPFNLMRSQYLQFAP